MRNIICQLLKKKRVSSPPIPIPTVQNQPEEIAYFNAYLLPITESANLQTALDTYGSVRLEKGNYTGSPIIIGTGQKLYGNPVNTGVPYITIEAGSTNVVLENLTALSDSDLQINFQAGGVISNCSIKTIRGANVIANNATIENNKFIDIEGSIRFNCSISGYFRNNRIIKHKAQSTSNMLVMKGNSTTPSYGNVNIHSNYLTSELNTTDLDNLQSATFIGIDCESYSGLTRELFYATNIGRINLATVQGGMLYDSGLGYYNIDADNLLSIYNAGNSISPSVIAPRTNYLNTFAYLHPTRSAGTVTGFTAYSDISNRNFMYNGVSQTNTISSSTALSNFITGTQYTPWVRPTYNTIPDPLGVNWEAERVGKPDSTSYIQNLININKIAELPEGIFYISSTLNLTIGAGEGIVGQGTGKTVICGLTDSFPLITTNIGTFGNFTLANLTLQGGNGGIYADLDTMLWAYQNMKFVVFRNQTSGIQTHQIFGFDNSFFDNVAFVNCQKGFFQDPLLPYIPGNLDGSSYVDKTVFYKNQFINCETGLSMQATRPNNMNAWVDCKFDGGDSAFIGGGDSTVFANCDFTNYTGTNVITTNGYTMFSSNFYNNSVTQSTFNCGDNNFEGCNFLDTTDMFTPDINNSIRLNAFNSIITGNALIVPNETYNRNPEALFVNCELISNAAQSKQLVNVKSGVTTVLIDATPNPYPQFLVTQ